MHSLPRGFEFFNLKSEFLNLKSPGSIAAADFRMKERPVKPLRGQSEVVSFPAQWDLRLAQILDFYATSFDSFQT
jgi:hypothetical protein